MTHLQIISFRGKDTLPYLQELAQLRMTVFREYPYLYDGSLENELTYLNNRAKCPDSFLIIVLDQDKVVGASTAIPLKNEMAEVQQPFIDQGYEIATIFYFGESVLLKPYHGCGIGKHFFEERLKIARESDQYHYATFCAVERPDHHPARPHDYQPLDELWQSQGFIKHPELTTNFAWKEIGEPKDSPKPMVFWVKKF